MGDWVYWLSWLMSVAIIVGMVYIAWWALFSDKPGGKRRCPRCWYDLSYAPPPGMTCAECGYTATREKQLAKTRRRYGIALSAMLVVVALAVFVNDRLDRFGWSTTLPTRVLMVALPYVEPHSSMYLELLTRAEQGALTDAQWLALMKRCARGDVTAAPPDEAWRGKYGRLILQTRRAIASSADDDVDSTYHAGETPLLTLPPLVQFSDLTMAGDDGATSWTVITLTEWWPHRSEVRLEITPFFEGGEGEKRIVRYLARGLRNNAIAVPVRPVEREVSEVSIAVNAYHRRDETSGWNHAGRTTHRIRMSAGHPETHAFEAIADEEITALLATVFRGEVVRWRGGQSPVRFAYHAYSTDSRALNGTAVGVVLELHRNEEVARRIEIWWLAGSQRPEPPLPLDGMVHWRVDFEDAGLLADLDADDERWRMRVRGVEDVARRVRGAERYWAGELDLPVTVHDRRGEAPQRDVWVE